MSVLTIRVSMALAELLAIVGAVFVAGLVAGFVLGGRWRR